jgi:hypothetical protein
MEKPHYPIINSDEGFSYEFDSISDLKTIRKVVVYLPYSDDGKIYQLAFGNLLENGKIDVYDKSANKDMIMILSTVIRTLLDFLSLHPEKSVIFTGSTGTRTRLYRATISKLFDSLQDILLVQGITFDLEEEPFDKTKDYYAFLISKKMERLKALPKRDPALFRTDSSLDDRYKKIIQQPEILKLQEELRAITSKVKGFPK